MLEGVVTFAEAEGKCEQLKAVAAAKVALMEQVQLETWGEVEATIPDFAKLDVLAKFNLKRGKTPPKSFMVSIPSLCDYLLKCIVIVDIM